MHAEITRARSAAGQITMTGRLFYGFILWWMDFLEKARSERSSAVKRNYYETFDHETKTRP